MPRFDLSPSASVKVRPDYLVAGGRCIDLDDVPVLLCASMHLDLEDVQLVDKDKGALGWTSRRDFYGKEGNLLAVCLHGGESQKGVVRLEMQGDSCARVHDWAVIHRQLREWGARIMRVDLCADLLGGEWTVDDALLGWVAGEFTTQGRPPAMSQAGNWLAPDGRGRTLYVGTRANGKLLRVYEKGKQLGDPTSPWVRWELELRAVERVIPLDVVLRGAEYLAGSSPMLKKVVQAAAERIRGLRRAATLRLDVIVQHARRSYGALVQYLHRHGVAADDIVAALSRPTGSGRAWMVPEGFSPGQVCAGIAGVGW